MSLQQNNPNFLKIVQFLFCLRDRKNLRFKYIRPVLANRTRERGVVDGGFDAVRRLQVVQPARMHPCSRLPHVPLVRGSVPMQINFSTNWRSSIHNVSESCLSIYGLESLILDEVWNPNRLRPDIPLKVARNGGCACGAGRCG